MSLSKDIENTGADGIYPQIDPFVNWFNPALANTGISPLINMTRSKPTHRRYSLPLVVRSKSTFTFFFCFLSIFTIEKPRLDSCRYRV